jgi:Domain of unknown function (DUF4388)
MSISSSFTDFSLPELFQLIDRGKKSGCLTVCTLPNLKQNDSKSQYYYIWFRQGLVVATANRLNGNGLIEKITQRGWMSGEVEKKLYTSKRTNTPLGLDLKTQGVLSAEKLNLLFASQLQQIRQLFEIQKGVFKLDSKAVLPVLEMTGLSVGATEVALMSLRVLKNWAGLADALPNVSSAIESITQVKSQLHLNPFEWQVWEFANGTVSLNAIASQLKQPVPIVQQAAFRLMVAGLIEEVPFIPSFSAFHDYPMDSDSVTKKTKEPRESKPLTVSTSFLQNLVGFLRSKS